MRPSLTHIALHVADLEACAAFYREVCGLGEVHSRGGEELGERIVWLAEPGAEARFVLVLLPGGPGERARSGDYSHLGFAVATREQVDAMAAIGRARGCLALDRVDKPYPAGSFCILRDPDGTAVEFSYGQPLGPGAA